MVQFYFLSIFVNFIGGLLLAGETINKQFTKLDTLQELFKAPTYLITFSIVAAVTGVFKIISVYNGDIPVIGDLLPAVISILIAIFLFFSYQKNKNGEIKSSFEKTDTLIQKYRNILGIAAITISLLHFFFPNVLFI
jgi:purine-cytosine permease-like protein